MAHSPEAELTDHLRRLCVEIGPRPLGSPANRAAVGYIGEVFRAAGLEVREWAFPCPEWRDEETLLELGGKRLPAAANAYSASCDLSAPTVAVGTVAELETAGMEGRIGVLYGDLATAPLTPKGCTLYVNERDQRIVQLLEEKRPAALITVNSRRGCMERLIEDWDLAIPSATVPPEAGLELLERAGGPVRLRIATQRAPGSSANVVARKAGARSERIVLCAHCDTKVDAPGALDNGSGVAALLALAGLLGRMELRVGLEFVAFSDHEYYVLGGGAYEARTGGEMGDILAAINLDGIGNRVGTNTVALMAASDQFRARLDELLARHPGMIWTEPWVESDHSSFAFRGVPSVAISSIGATHLCHLPTDTIEWISPAKLREVVDLVTAIVQSLDDKPLGWTREGGSQ